MSINVESVQPAPIGSGTEVRFVCMPGNIIIELTVSAVPPNENSQAVPLAAWDILADYFRGWQNIALNEGCISDGVGSRWPLARIEVRTNEPREGGPPRAHLVLQPTQTKIALDDYIDDQYSGRPDVPPHVWTKLASQLGDWYTDARRKHDPRNFGWAFGPR